MAPARNVILRGKRRVFDDFFKIDELTVSHWLRDGTMSPDRRFLVFERGDAVAALIFNRDTLQVILVDQFKAGAFEKGRLNGWIVETMAGMIKAGETPERAVIRETLEETGYKISDPQLITTFFSSPGGTSERIFLYYAEVENADRVAPGGGKRKEGEDIELVTMPAEALFERLRNGAIEDPKLIIAAYWFKDRLGLAPTKKTALPYRTRNFTLKSDPSLVIGYKTGDIIGVRGVDVWVNSENTGMIMDRVIGKTVSANIRYGGATKDKKGNVVKDTIADALRNLLDGRNYVPLGTVLDTDPGALRESNDVSRVFHIATVEGLGGKGVQADPARIPFFVETILETVHRKNRGFKIWSSKYKSILMPFFGTGDGGVAVEEVAPAVIEAAVNFLKKRPATELKSIYFLAFSARERDACDKAMSENADLDPAR